MKKTIAFVTAALALLASCDKLDTVGNYSIRSFGELLNAMPQLVSADDANKGWSLAAPDNSARFIWGLNDIMLEFDIIPFIDAGLDPNKLPEYFDWYDDGTSIIRTKLENKEPVYNGELTPLASYERIVKLKRQAIGYHAQLDHYGVDLENGNMFEWAKDLSTNDKDIVFVLNPAPFIAAGADPQRIEGWLFSTVTVDDENGKPIQVDKILKPFDLR